MKDSSYTANGTIGGTVLTILANITTGELAKTAILAAVGAVVSYVVSMLLKRWMKSRKDS